MIASAQDEVVEEGVGEDATAEPDAFHKLYLATLGAGVVMREEGGRLFEYLVARGTPLEEPVRERAAAARKAIGAQMSRAGESVNRVVGRGAQRASGARTEDLADLASEVDRLEERAKKLE